MSNSLIEQTELKKENDSKSNDYDKIVKQQEELLKLLNKYKNDE